MNIIVAIDGREERHDALALGADLAHSHGGRLLVVHVYPWSRWSARLGSAYEVTIREDAEALLASATSDLEDVPFESRAVAEMSIPRALHRLAQEENADIIVIGSSHRGPIGRTLAGGTGERVLHASPCPVAIAPHAYRRTKRDPRQIGVAYDASPQARAALAWARDLAAGVGATVTVLDVYEPILVTSAYPGVAFPFDELDSTKHEACQRDIDQAVAMLPKQVRPTGTMLRGPVAKALAEAAQDLDLLVTGSRGYGPHGALLLGSVTHQLSHMAPCPLVVLPLSAIEAGKTESAEHAAATSER